LAADDVKSVVYFTELNLW